MYLDLAALKEMSLTLREIKDYGMLEVSSAVIDILTHFH